MIPSSGPARRAVEDDDLTAAGVRVLRVGGRVAVEAQVACGSARRGRTARRRRRSSRRPARRRALGRCPAGRAGRWSGWVAALAPMATEPSKLATVSRKAVVRSAPSARRCDTRVGMTLASVVISAARRSPSAAFRSAKLSTSPLRAAVTYGPGRAVELQAVDGMRVRLRDDPDAGPARVAEDDGGGAARRSGPVAAGRRRARSARMAAVLSPSSPISAAAL